MTTTRERWDKARDDLIDRWEQILQKIGEKDEAAILELSTVMDEFCDVAIGERAQADLETGRAGGSTESCGAEPGTPNRCVFCRGFQEAEGCMGLLTELNRAIFAGNWQEAGELARGYITRLRGMDLSDPKDTAIH